MASAAVERRERLKQLAVEIIDLQKGPYFMINRLDTYECNFIMKAFNQDSFPKHRVMIAFEQKIEQADKNYQYLIFAGAPYENISFKIPNSEIEIQDGKFQPIWDKDKKIYSLRVQFREKKNNK